VSVNRPIIAGVRNTAAWKFPKSTELVLSLDVFSHSSEALRLYNQSCHRTDKRDHLPTNPLLDLPSHPSRDLSLARSRWRRHVADALLPNNMCTARPSLDTFLQAAVPYNHRLTPAIEVLLEIHMEYKELGSTQCRISELV